MTTKNGIGLVLCGGGARGAFEMGVWKELDRLGITKEITGFSGTSIGAINTALFLANNDISDKEDIWENFEQSDMLTPKDLKRLLASIIVKIPSVEIPIRILTGLFSQNKLEELLDELVFDLDSLRQLDIFTTVTEVSLPNNTKTAFINWENLTEEEIKRYVLCSATIPFINGYHRSKRFMRVLVDGGVPDKIRDNLSNTPIAPLYAIGYRKFIVVYLDDCNSFGEQIEKENKWFPDCKMCRIFMDYGGNYEKKPLLMNMMEINPALTRNRIAAGTEAVKYMINRPARKKLLFVSTNKSKDNMETITKTKECIKRGEKIKNGIN